MNRRQSTDLGRDLVQFFNDYLPNQRGMSPHTIRSYRDTVVLLLEFVVRDTNRPVERLEIADLTADRIVAFLNSLETERHNGIATRNVRLGAIHVFARFSAARRPEHLGTLQQVIGLPFKRGAPNAPIEYLDRDEIEALLNSIDQDTRLGRRDYALFALMFNTGARVQEVLNLRCRDVRFEAPRQVRLHGKADKVRTVPIWPATVRVLRTWMHEIPVTEVELPDSLLFTNARGQPMTRFGVRYLLRKYVAIASGSAPTLKNKRIHPHSLRHSTAVALLKAGVDFVTISQWLGHASINTTMRYARADLELKRQALSQVFPDIVGPPRGGQILLDGTHLIGWLRQM